LIERAQALRARTPAEVPKRGAVDGLLAELLQLRASPRLENERKQAERLAHALEGLERAGD
jgi:hypothetical protein